MKQVIVIGGGVVGLTSAWWLLEAGFGVTLLERAPGVGSAASARNGGQLSYRYVAPLADAGVPFKALQWLFDANGPLRFRPEADLRQWRCLPVFYSAATRAPTAPPRVNCCNWANCRERRWGSSNPTSASTIFRGATPANWSSTAAPARLPLPQRVPMRASCSPPPNALRANRHWLPPRRSSPAASTTAAKPWPTATPFARRWPRACRRTRAFAASCTPMRAV